jgi:hypothetical protein
MKKDSKIAEMVATLENQLMCAVDQVRNLQQQSLMEETLERIYIQTQ